MAVRVHCGLEDFVKMARMIFSVDIQVFPRISFVVEQAVPLVEDGFVGDFVDVLVEDPVDDDVVGPVVVAGGVIAPGPRQDRLPHCPHIVECGVLRVHVKRIVVFFDGRIRTEAFRKQVIPVVVDGEVGVQEIRAVDFLTVFV